MGWTDFKEIKNIILKKWEKGEIARGKLLFPWKIKLKVPTSKEILNDISKFLVWRKELKKTDKSSLGYGYNIIEKEIKNKILGKNPIPAYIEIVSVDDALKLIKKENEMKRILENSSFILEKYPKLQKWIEKNIFKILIEKDEIKKILAVVEYILKNPVQDTYLREISIENIDTKFIENHKKIIFTMLDEILSDDSSLLEEKLSIKKKPQLIRFRILDEKYYIHGFSDISVPIEEFNEWENNFSNVFFTENEISFLTFPSYKNTLIIFSKGYNIHAFKENKWLNNKKLYYWGDMDTHGFNILGIAREIFPDLKSFLMNEEIFFKHKEFWVVEDKPFLAEVKGLNYEESLFCKKLQENIWGKNLRLEQERINFSYLKEYLKKLNANSDS